MPRERLCKVCRGWHDPENWPQECMTQEASKQLLPAPMVIQDTMGAVQSMTNGLWYDSKSALRKEYARAGVVEVGNDVLTKKPKVTAKDGRKKRRESIGKALSQAGFGAP